MIGNDIINSDSNVHAQLSALNQCDYVAPTQPRQDIDTTDVALHDVESCKLVGGVQCVARALQIT